MKIAIRYYTKSKKGNTEKIAKFIENKINVPALDVTHPLEEEVEQFLLVNAMYAADIDKEIKQFLRNNKDKIKTLININSAASGASTLKAVKKVCDKEGINVSEKEFHTVASWIFINKGRPNEEDFARLEAFLKEVVVNG
ncbi:MAG: flavodoxin [Bacilli bacterium]|nr:flavodoxin [Bacilli bacterium]MDY6430588.1 flavodoxin [Bacilli bacterium]